MLLTKFISIAAMFLSTPSLAIDHDVNATEDVSFFMAATHLDRLNLARDSDLKYDFSTNPYYGLEPGSVCNANAATMPWLVGTGMMVAQLNLGPCAMLPPHSHRAMNIVVAVSGTTTTYMIQENGARLVTQTLTPGQLTVFPQSSMHTMVNDECTPAQLYSFLNSDDAGTVNVMNNVFQFPADIIYRILPFLNHDNAANASACLNEVNYNASIAQIPAVGTGSNGGTADCMARCGLNGTSARRVVRQ